MAPKYHSSSTHPPSYAIPLALLLQQVPCLLQKSYSCTVDDPDRLMTQASLRYFNCSRKTVIKSFLLQELQYAAAIVSFNIHCRVNHPHSLLQSSLMPRFKITSDWIISSIKSETCSLHVKILYLQIPPSQNPQVWWRWEPLQGYEKNPELRTLNPKDVLEEPQRSLKSFPLLSVSILQFVFSVLLLVDSSWQICKSSMLAQGPKPSFWNLGRGTIQTLRQKGEQVPPLWTRSPPCLEPPPNTKLVSTSLKSRFVSPLMLRTSWSFFEIRGNFFES